MVSMRREVSKILGIPRPRWVLMDMYRAVPLKLFLSLYGMCCLLECRINISVILFDVFVGYAYVLGSRYCLAIPKSTT